MLQVKGAGCLLVVATTLSLSIPSRAQVADTSEEARGETATVSGFVTDGADGRPLEGATVALYADSTDAVPDYGTATNSDGIYLIRGIAPGRYRLRISFVGYEPYTDTLDLAPGEVRTVSVRLTPEAETLEEVFVEGEREHGVARVTAGLQRIRPEEIELVPSPDISADLANYLTTLPGIVTTGDRGGQFFVRGGEPSQNLVLLDGITLYQPVHVLGFYSAFPTDIINSVDLYAGGFGVEYVGRLSSVIDVSARSGNERRFAGAGSLSPFTGTVRLEGPLVPGKLSFLASARESLIEDTGPSVYGEAMPFQFGDVFGKIHLVPDDRSKLSVTAFHTYDRGTLVNEIAQSEAQEVRWTNDGIGVRWLFLPRIIPVASELIVSRSRHTMEQGTPGETVRSTNIRSTRIAFNATFFNDSTTTKAGWEAVFSRTRNDLGGLFQNVEASVKAVPSFGLYLESEVIFRGLHLFPGVRGQWYNVRFRPYLEPRLRLAWERGIHHFSGAVGMYQQQLIGLTDRRDAASVFMAWTGIPWERRIAGGLPGDEVLRGRIGRSYHALIGYRAAPTRWVELSVEGFYKRMTNLFVGEWTAFPQLDTRLQPATGRSAGFELRVELRRGPAYGYITYGLSSTVYAVDGDPIAVWYGAERLRYRPAHDRRHQLNALLSGKVFGFEASARWAFGSGLPFTRPLAFDGFALVDDIRRAEDLEHSRRVIYERPFDSVLPPFHRLDVSLKRTWHLREAALTLQASVINAYDRRNIFYVDLFTLKRQDQLPIVPTLGIKIAFE